MGLVARLLGHLSKQEHEQERGMSRLQAATREKTRRELITMALRDTLRKHGLAAGCVTAEGVPSIAPDRRRGMHIQLVFHDRQPGLAAYVLALESAVQSRLVRLDPLAPSWITGLSWRFEPTDRTLWPQLPTTDRPGNGRPVMRDPVSASPAAALHKRLLASDGDARSALAVRADFGPTLPMVNQQAVCAR